MARLDDPERLEALTRSGLLKYQQDDRLVNLCYTATELLDCDVSQINVITADQQIFLAEYPRVERAPVDLTNSGCREVVLAEEPLIVNNALEHPIFCAMKWTEDWKSYLGVPLIIEGRVLGSMCALTVVPRVWTRKDILTLEGLVRLVNFSLEMEIA